jgi:hypothetical protein
MYCPGICIEGLKKLTNCKIADHGRYYSQALPEYKSEKLPFEKTCWVIL